MTNFEQIGVIKSKFTEPVGPEEMQQQESTIVINPEYEAGLYKIEDVDYLQVIFNLHHAEGYTLQGPRRYGEERGVFASRSPKRPNSIGVTTVKLLNRDDNKLLVTGLDAIDGTPVLDLKPYAVMMDQVDRFSNKEE
ncbi:tRNA (N6-threonylcarbamoyladenosine(37)-N6)-methyltransferase TrmO [Halanaerobaculum tunisiense]